MRHVTKFIARVVYTLANGNATFYLTLIAILAIALAAITVNALVVVTLAILGEG